MHICRHHCKFTFAKEDWKEEEKRAYDSNFPLEAKAATDPFTTSRRFYTMRLIANDPFPKPFVKPDGSIEPYWLWNNVSYSIPVSIYSNI